MKDWILYEDNHIIIVNKPSKLPVQGDKTGDNTLLDIGKDYIKKIYWAIVKNKINQNSGELIHFLKKNRKLNKSFVGQEEQKGFLKSQLKYKLLKKLNNYFLYEIELITGRHHQIRAQLSEIGSPIKGDIKYNAKRTNKDGSINLHSRNIKFIHPIKKTEISITAPTPNDPIWKSC